MKKSYMAPSMIVAKAALSAFIATSEIDYGGSNTGDDKPHTADSKGDMWESMDAED